MSSKPVVLREAAEAEAQAAIDYYALEVGTTVALDFLNAYEAAVTWIGAHPTAGSPRHAEAAQMPGLRSRALGRFPYVIFYLETKDRVDVLRILHQRRDIPAILRREEP